MNNKGQAIFSEYVMIFFVVIAVGVTMTTFVRRGLEGRIHDARNFMIDTVNSVCDADCMQATGGSAIPYQYESYYEQHLAMVKNSEKSASGTTPSLVNWSLGAKYLKFVNGQSNSTTNSIQLPPECAGANPPPYCGDGSLPP